MSPGMVIDRLDEVSKIITTEMTKHIDSRFKTIENRLDSMCQLSGGPSDEVVAVRGSECQDQVERPAVYLYKSHSFQDPFAAPTKKHLTDWDVPETFSFPTPTLC